MTAKLEQTKKMLYLSYQLATIKTERRLELTCEQLEVQQPAAEELLGLFKKYEFKRSTADVEAGGYGYRQKGQNQPRSHRKPVLQTKHQK
ncbi:hypothetical protein ACLK2G_20295 [Escherichia coli]